jgi:hypothetical protein
MKDTVLVIQGHCRWPFIEETIKYYSQFNNIIWSTWINDISPETINLLNNYNINYILNFYPREVGNAHSNYMKQSTLAGIRHARKYFNPKYIFKTRTDFTFEKLPEVIDRLEKTKNDKISLISWDNLPITMHSNDQICFGPIDDIELLYSFDNIYGHTEQNMLDEFLRKKGLPIERTYENIKKYFYFMYGDFLDINAVIKWWKYPDDQINMKYHTKEFKDRYLY